SILFEAFDYAIGGDVRLSEMRHVFGAAVGHPAGRAALFAWEKASWAKLRARLPNSFGWGQLIGVTGGFCTASQRSDAQAFFSEAARPIEGAARVLEESMESSGLCVALREHSSSDLSKYL